MSGWLERIPGTPAWRMKRNMALCEATRSRIQEIVDGELPATEANRALLRHLKACERCGLEAEALEELKRAVRRVARSSGEAIVERARGTAAEIARTANGNDPSTQT